MGNIKLVCAVLLVSSAFSFPSRSDAQETASDQSKGGSICVLPNSPEPPTRMSPGGDYNPDTLQVSIYKQEPTRWPHKKPILIESLDVQKPHLVVLTSDGKRIHSFWFKFSEYHDVRLCMSFDGYQGVQLEDPTIARWCKVKQSICWR